MMIMILNLMTIYGPIAACCLLAFWIYMTHQSFSHRLEMMKKDICQHDKYRERMQREIDILREDIKKITDSIGDIKASTGIISRIESDLKEMRSRWDR